MSTIEDIKARLDIVETVREYVPELKKSGRTWKANCPFHSERTPSFVVDPGRGTWHCFGACSTGGDVIEFVRRSEGLDFKEALGRCAERAGIELKPPSPREREERETHERLLSANEAAAVFFQAAFRGAEAAEARDYVERRGLDQATIERWQLGYAPDGWRGLIAYLEARGFSEADLVEAGLAVEGDRGAYDRFRNRLIFPTRDARKRLIGFGARALRAEDAPKYLNTPQTPLFDKSGTLYGLDLAADEARRADRIVVVEGYMDVIAAHQYGIRNVVASMGTAITDKQMELIKRVTQNVVLALDADTAGSEATLRGIEVAASAADRETVATVDWRGLVSYHDVLQADIRVVTLPPGEDPDSMVRSDPERFKALIEGALPVTDHLFEAVTSQMDAADPRSRSRALQALVPAVSAITDAVVRSHYVQRLARIAQVDERTVSQALAGAARSRLAARARPAPVASSAEVREAKRRKVVAPDGEQQILQLLLRRGEGRAAGLELDPDLFEDSTNRIVFQAWIDDADLEERFDDLDEEVRERLTDLRGATVPDYEPRQVEPAVREMAWRLRLKRQQERLQSIALEQARELQERRRGSPEATDEAPAEEPPLEAFEEMTRRQRELTRRYQEATGRRPVATGADHDDREAHR